MFNFLPEVEGFGSFKTITTYQFYDKPLLSIQQDSNNNLFLCLCTDFSYSYDMWVLAKVDENTIMLLEEKYLDLRSFYLSYSFEPCVVLKVYNGGKYKVSYAWCRQIAELYKHGIYVL